jgi:t-SNARE complex subunit (syntaxin)
MDRIISAAIEEVREQISEPVDATKEPSRLIRLMHIKYKCFVIFLLAIIAIMTIVYITIKEVLDDEETTEIIKQVLNYRNGNDTKNVGLRE